MDDILACVGVERDMFHPNTCRFVYTIPETVRFEEDGHVETS